MTKDRFTTSPSISRARHLRLGAHEFEVGRRPGQRLARAEEELCGRLEKTQNSCWTIASVRLFLRPAIRCCAQDSTPSGQLPASPKGGCGREVGASGGRYVGAASAGRQVSRGIAPSWGETHGSQAELIVGDPVASWAESPAPGRTADGIHRQHQRRQRQRHRPQHERAGYGNRAESQLCQ